MLACAVLVRCLRAACELLVCWRGAVACVWEVLGSRRLYPNPSPVWGDFESLGGGEGTRGGIHWPKGACDAVVEAARELDGSLRCAAPNGLRTAATETTTSHTRSEGHRASKHWKKANTKKYTLTDHQRRSGRAEKRDKWQLTVVSTDCCGRRLKPFFMGRENKFDSQSHYHVCGNCGDRKFREIVVKYCFVLSIAKHI